MRKKQYLMFCRWRMIEIDYNQRFLKIIQEDKEIMAFLLVVEKLKLNDAWICAGVLRNKVWDTVSKKSTAINDIDVIYFDPTDTSWATEKALEIKLRNSLPNKPWSIKNQARMHLKSGFKPFNSSYDGVSHFPEIPTVIAARIFNGELEVIAPYGLEDLFEMRVKPTRYYEKDTNYHNIYVERVQSKNWEKLWGGLRIQF